MNFLDLKGNGLYPRFNKNGSRTFRIVVKYKDVGDKWCNKEYSYNLKDDESDLDGYTNAVSMRDARKRELEKQVQDEKNRLEAEAMTKKCNVNELSPERITFEMLSNIWLETKIKSRNVDVNGVEHLELACSKSYFEESRDNIAFYNNFKIDGYRFGEMKITNITSDVILKIFNYIDNRKKVVETIKGKDNPRDVFAKYGYGFNTLRKKLGINCCSLNNLINGKNVSAQFAESVCQKTGIPFSELFERKIITSEYEQSSLYGFKKTMRAIFSFAMDTKHWLKYNPAISKGILIYNTSEKKMPSMTDEEAIKFFIAANEFPIEIRVPMRFQLLTTCRPEETAGLNIDDIDLDGKIIYIKKAFIPGFIERKTTKTKSSRRAFAIPDILEKELIEYEKWRNQFKSDLGDVYQDSGQFFCSSTGKRLDRDTLLKMFKKVRDKAGLPKCYTTYSTRHTNITLLAEEGVDINTLATIAGHGDTKTTTRYYVSTSMDAKRAAANKVNEHYQEAYQKENMSKEEQLADEFKEMKAKAEQLGLSVSEYIDFLEFRKAKMEKASDSQS